MDNKITYKDFFGLKEQAMSKADPTKDVVLSAADAKDPKKVQAAQNILKTTKGRIHIEEEMVDEAQLLNRITDYKGGVEYVLIDPATAINVADEIKQFAAKKNIDIIKYNFERILILCQYKKAVHSPNTKYSKSRRFHKRK